MSRVKSDHSNLAEDRTFDMECLDVDKGVENLSTTCSWTGEHIVVRKVLPLAQPYYIP